MKFLLGIKSFLSPFSTYLYIAAAVACFGAGWTVHGWKYGAQEARQAVQDVKTVKDDVRHGNEATKALQAQETKTVTVYRTIKEKVYATTTNASCLGGDAVKLWNDALIGVPDDTTGSTDQTGGTDTPEASEQEVSVNLTDNAELWKKQRDRANALIDYIEEHVNK
jgi:hypothetical protein